MGANGGAPPRALHAECGVHIILMRPGEADLHIEGIYIQLFTNQGRQTGGHALPHLGASRVKTNGIVRQHLQEGVRRPGTLRSRHR